MKKPKLLYQNFEIINLLKNAKIPLGGAAVEWYTWLRAFKQIGCEVGLLTYKNHGLSNNQNQGFDIVESYHSSKGFPVIRRLTYRIPLLFSATKKYKPDFLIQGCATLNTGILAIIAKLLKIPFVHRIGSDMDVDGRIRKSFSFYTYPLYKYGIKISSHISCQNKYQYEILKEKYPKKSISVLYNPFFFKENKIKVRTERNYIAWVGNFRYEKNLPALAEVAAKFPNMEFRIAGTRFANTDADAAKGLEVLERLNNVKFLGHINNSEVTDLLSNALCLLNTSRLEGFSNTFLEAWSVGTPVVTTSNVNPDKIISNFNVGIVAENYSTIENKIKLLLNYNENEYKILSENCVNYVKENHDPIKLAKIFLEEMLNVKK